MPRKSKDVYSKINEKEEQIKQLKEKLSTYETELIQLNKERELFEMKQIFETAKEHNMNYDQVIDLILRGNNSK